MQSEERLRVWIEQGNVNISQLFFQHYKALNLSERESMLLLQMISFQAEGKLFPIPSDLANRMQITENEVSRILQSMMQRGLLTITQNQDASGVLYESFSLQPLWSRLVDEAIKKEQLHLQQDHKNEEGELFAIFEQEFGRLLSPMECESITMWLDEDGHRAEIIRAALKEAVIAQKLSLRYIDRILFEWKKKNVKTLQDVEQQTKSFRAIGTAPQKRTNVKRAPLYNWLEERE